MEKYEKERFILRLQSKLKRDETAVRECHMASTSVYVIFVNLTGVLCRYGPQKSIYVYLRKKKQHLSHTLAYGTFLFITIVLKFLFYNY